MFRILCIGLFIQFAVASNKLCTNCKHYMVVHSNALLNIGKCRAFPKWYDSETTMERKRDDMLMSKDHHTTVFEGNDTTADYFYCSTARAFNCMCGKEGIMFEERKIMFEERKIIPEKDKDTFEEEKSNKGKVSE